MRPLFLAAGLVVLIGAVACGPDTPAPTATTEDVTNPTITAILTPEPTPPSTPTATRTPTPVPTATPTSPLRGFVNGRWLEQRDPQLASSIRELDWVQDGIDDTESEVMQDLLYIAVTSRFVTASIVSLNWVQDGIDEVEVRAIDWMNNIADAEVASSVVALGWVQDGIDEVEVRTIEELSYIANKDTGVGLSVVAFDWVQDGIDEVEVKAIDWMTNIADRDAGAALRIVGMPFVETIEPPDVAAMGSLSQLAAHEPGTFERVMSHAALRDGISDDLAPVVATLRGVAKTNPVLIDVLLDPDRVFLERRTITLPLSGDIVLVIIRTSPGAARSMELLEHAVRSVEEYLGSALPTNYVGLLYENAVISSYLGTNFETHIAILPKFDVDDGSHEAEANANGIAHEVAHYYWSGNADWVDEGAADLMASLIGGAPRGRPIGITNRPCAYAGNIVELEGHGISQGDAEFLCNYALGERLFVDLYRTLGDERFREGFRALYLASEVEDADDYGGTAVGIGHLSEAFRADDGAASAVIARWYDGTEPYDLSRLDTGPIDPGLTGINGRIDEAYIATGTDGPGVTVFSAQSISDWAYLTLEYSHNVAGGPYEVSLEIVEYYEDGFAFDRSTTNLTAEAQYIGGTSWYQIGFPPTRKWALGSYWVYVYAGEKKVAEVKYEVAL